MSICVLECTFVMRVLFIVIYMSIYVKPVTWTTGYNFFKKTKLPWLGALVTGYKYFPSRLGQWLLAKNKVGTMTNKSPLPTMVTSLLRQRFGHSCSFSHVFSCIDSGLVVGECPTVSCKSDPQKWLRFGVIVRLIIIM